MSRGDLPERDRNDMWRQLERRGAAIAAHDLDPATITIDPIPDPAARLLGPKPPDPDLS